MNTLNTRDFHHKIVQFERFHAEYTKNLGHSMRFFWKIGKFALISVKLTSRLTFWVENPHKIEVEIVHKLYPAKTSTIIVENTKNLPNSSSYTIEYNVVRNSHLLSQNWHFLKCHSNCSRNKHKLLTCKIIKAAIDCSYVYCEGKYDKVLQTRTFLFKCTIVFAGVKRLTDIITLNTKQINSTHNINYNKNIS